MSNAPVIEEYKETDWTEDRPKANSIYLKLTDKGQKEKIRIVSKPVMFTKVYTNDDGTEDKSYRYAVKVIHRNMETKTNEVKGFEFGGMIFDHIQSFFKDGDYGNPTGYDLEITRTEEKGKYYTVIPKPPKPLTEEEKELVANADIDLERMYLGDNTTKIETEDEDPFAD